MVVDVMHILSLQGYNLIKNKLPTTQLAKCWLWSGNNTTHSKTSGSVWIFEHLSTTSPAESLLKCNFSRHCVRGLMHSVSGGKTLSATRWQWRQRVFVLKWQPWCNIIVFVEQGRCHPQYHTVVKSSVSSVNMFREDLFRPPPNISRLTDTLHILQDSNCWWCAASLCTEPQVPRLNVLLFQFLVLPRARGMYFEPKSDSARIVYEFQCLFSWVYCPSIMGLATVAWVGRTRLAWTALPAGDKAWFPTFSKVVYLCINLERNVGEF
jgi:hypothetical protein